MTNQSLGGMEVPVVGSDAVKWIEISVPSAWTTADSAAAHHYAPLTEDVASCHIIGDPPTYLIWRIHKKLPHALELLEVSACKEFPRIGLRLMFHDALCPFTFICKDENQVTTGSPYLLYAVTVSGIAYLFKLRNLHAYASCSLFPRSELIEFNIRTHQQSETITAITAIMGCLVIGRSDGSVGCFQLGILDQSAAGFMHELRDDVGIGRLWGLMARGRTVGAVLDLAVLEVHGNKLIFVLHVDGNLRVWDLLSYTRILRTTISKLCVGEVNNDKSLIPLAILYRSLEVQMAMISICSLQFCLGDKITLSLEPFIKTIPFEEGRIVDLIITSNKVWILKDDVLTLYNLFHTDDKLGETHSYGLQESFVADELFQGHEHSLDDVIWANHSLFPSVKDQIAPFFSSIFLRRLLRPGVQQSVALSATINDYNKLPSDVVLQSLTVDSLKGEIISLIESEGITENPISVVHSWRKFCNRYFHYWCEYNKPYGLLVDSSTGTVGLIRRNSISLFRHLEDIELLIYGCFDEYGDSVSSWLDLPDNDLDREIIFEVLRCVSKINQQLGKAAASVFYESLASAPIISSEVIVPCLLKILETGYSSSIEAVNISSLVGADTAFEKELADHKRQREFSVDVLLMIHAVYNKATTWDRVLNAIENYLKFLVPRKSLERLDSSADFSMNTSILVQAASQVAKMMFESAFGILLLLGYLVNISGQVLMAHEDISKIQLELIPMVQEILTEWLVIHFLGTTPSESQALQDFSSQLSSLHIDSNNDNISWNEKLGTCNFTLACILLPDIKCSSDYRDYLSSRSFPSPNNIISALRNISSWIIWGKTGEESSSFFSRSTEIALILLRHGQYEAVENLFAIVDGHSCKERIPQSVQGSDGIWCMHHHLLGCCLLAQAQCGLQGTSKERKVREAVRCFFRASSGQGALQALQSLSFQTGLSNPGHIWKLLYYQWAMQIFEQYNMSEGACQFALAALEQVDEVLGLKDEICDGDPFNEPATTIRGRLWANVFKFTLDLHRYYDAYCAIISNPDEDSKYICLRRFIIVLCEQGISKTLCDGQLPFIGLMEKVEQELALKAERSDVAAKPNPYKLLYSFEMHRHNWRRAASYMYRYTTRLMNEATPKDDQQLSIVLHERLNGLSAVINALHLVGPTYSWIDPHIEGYSCLDEHYPHKRARTFCNENSVTSNDVQSQKVQYNIDIEKLENEFVLTLAQYLLSCANAKSTFTGNQKLSSDIVDLLIQTNLYDIAFTILLRFWKGSGLKSELERIFVAIALKCCPNGVVSTFNGKSFRMQGLVLTSSANETFIQGASLSQQSSGNFQWEQLKIYLEKYKKLHTRLPVIVAETLLHTDPQIELPLWLVHMFKFRQRAWGMTGQEADPASLFRLYVDYGRYAEATNLLIEYIEEFASLRPADIVNRKKMSAIWFPYTSIERLWCQIEELRSSGHMIEQCDKLKKLLHGALLNHLKLVQVDSHDALSSVF
uniref:Nuclear pore complex protein NUP160 n=1 Tax=Nelumbo nucifera TaxID=4432 RepID=A0A822Z1K0_NELNU|nr:TPA_asm: hypothetical protein HUJ06_007976 [Nelumbo nucifera]